MGCTRPFFRPLLSQDGTDKITVQNYLEKYSKLKEMLDDTLGKESSVSFLAFNDIHFNLADIKDAKNYNYFQYRETSVPITVDAFYRRVMNLCSRVILKDPIGPDKYLCDIFGYTPKDLMQMDYASTLELETRVLKMLEENEKTLIEKTKNLTPEG